MKILKFNTKLNDDLVYSKLKPEPWMHIAIQEDGNYAIYVWDTRQVISTGKCKIHFTKFTNLDKYTAANDNHKPLVGKDSDKFSFEDSNKVANKSVQFDIALAVAKKFNIANKPVVNKYTGKTELAYYGSISDFMKQLKSKAFTQLTMPNDFSDHIKNKINIDVFIHTDKTDQTKGISTRYCVNGDSSDIK